MKVEIDVENGVVLKDGLPIWTVGEAAPAPEYRVSVSYLSLAADLVIAEEDVGGVATFIFDEEEFPDSILTSRMVKRFVKKNGIVPVMQSRAFAIAKFSWGAITFRVDPRQGDMYMRIGTVEAIPL